MITPQNQFVHIKGVRDGLLITLEEGHYDDVLQELTNEIAYKQAFLRGSQIILQVGQRPLARQTLAELRDLFESHEMTLWTVLAGDTHTRDSARDLGLAIRLAGSQTDLDGNLIQLESEPLSSQPTQPVSTALMLRETLRSGRMVQHEGDIVIIGDVNPGAEIVAGGHILVWGRLRGLVHAGAFGDETAIVCALDLNPTQIRIADKIAIPPKENGRQPVPEQAVIRSDQIIAEPWNPK